MTERVPSPPLVDAPACLILEWPRYASCPQPEHRAARRIPDPGQLGNRRESARDRVQLVWQPTR